MRNRVIEVELDDTPKKTGKESIINLLKPKNKPLTLRGFYNKITFINSRSVRRNIEELVHQGILVSIKCPCGHSNLYSLK